MRHPERGEGEHPKLYLRGAVFGARLTGPAMRLGVHMRVASDAIYGSEKATYIGDAKENWSRAKHHLRKAIKEIESMEYDVESWIEEEQDSPIEFSS